MKKVMFQSKNKLGEYVVERRVLMRDQGMGKKMDFFCIMICSFIFSLASRKFKMTENYLVLSFWVMGHFRPYISIRLVMSVKLGMHNVQTVIAVLRVESDFVPYDGFKL